jgi:hypothetical protein
MFCRNSWNMALLLAPAALALLWLPKLTKQECKVNNQIPFMYEAMKWR